MADTSWEHAAEARAALNAIVTDPEHGVGALSSPRTMSNLLKDLLPDAPREKNLLVAAAEAGLADTLREHVDQGMDSGTAIRLTASSFSERSPLSADACSWVTNEIAKAMGISEGTVAGGAAWADPGPGGAQAWAGQPSFSPPSQNSPPSDSAADNRSGPGGWASPAGAGAAGGSGAGAGNWPSAPGTGSPGGIGAGAGNWPSAPGTGSAGSGSAGGAAAGAWAVNAGEAGTGWPGGWSGAANPVASSPSASTQASGGAGTSSPGFSDPGAGGPFVGNPGTSNPGTSNPGASNPGASNPGASSPGGGNHAGAVGYAPTPPGAYPAQPGYSPASGQAFGQSFGQSPGQAYPAVPAPGQAYPAVPGPGYQPVPGRSGSSNTLAVVAFVLGIAQIVGWFIFLFPGLLAAILAIVLGFVSVKQMNRSGERGRGLAITGIILGFAGIVIVAILVVIGLAIVNKNN